MDAARALIAEADAAQRAPAAARRRALSVTGGPQAEKRPRQAHLQVEVVRTGIGAEKRWPLVGALILAIVIPLLLPARFSLGPRWVVPTVVAVLLVAIVVADRAGSGRRQAIVRALSLGLGAVLVAEAAGVTARLIGGSH